MNFVYWVVLAVILYYAYTYLTNGKLELFTSNAPDVVLPEESDIADILDDFFNTAEDPTYIAYIMFLVEKKNKFPVLVSQEAYDTFINQKHLGGKLTSDMVTNYIKTKGSS